MADITPGSGVALLSFRNTETMGIGRPARGALSPLEFKIFSKKRYS